MNRFSFICAIFAGCFLLWTAHTLSSPNQESQSALTTLPKSIRSFEDLLNFALFLIKLSEYVYTTYCFAVLPIVLSFGNCFGLHGNSGPFPHDNYTIRVSKLAKNINE